MLKTALVTLAIISAATLYAAAESGENIFYSKCSGCHSSSLSLNKKKSTAQWQSTIKRMKKHGLSISSAETNAVAAFLAGGK
ncbi:quinohemoprotein amine dehydrogenase, 60 kDa subunit [Denitrovibrio acetiphilus DSM 12809]|uniref:Quinohemoprotein amine dehydrogenase, 60 kDa subunit n=1 Tax=Denitrovibrio acetiphilus (strain DSM 12809 / NBRC 114555 / N2460) TaxID=522772 RepID=D4H2N8_DENA2|nr:cytochrome c [Denitrovibrio acetiphilus]ADD67099.1 quinohemoprotein amine dehydrogenase, 60 kDa subunit [Denitrovibrio acetiphilus DSM 12809]